MEADLETFLRGMETEYAFPSVPQVIPLETFLRGMETLVLLGEILSAHRLETFLRGMETGLPEGVLAACSGP